jgi:hypothetical protein
LADQLPRVFCDFNATISEDGYALWLPKSKDDLDALGADLREGLRVVIHQPGELEMQAVLAFDVQYNTWVGTAVEGTTRYLDGSEN